MKLERILLMGAMPLALALGGCSQNVNVTNNQVNQSGSGSVVISNNSEQKQEISLNTNSRKQDYNYFYKEDFAYILSTSKRVSVSRINSHIKNTVLSQRLQVSPFSLMIDTYSIEDSSFKDISSLNEIPSNYKFREIDLSKSSDLSGTPDFNNCKVGIYYDSDIWQERIESLTGDFYLDPR